MGNPHLSRLTLRRRLSATALALAVCFGSFELAFARPLESVRQAGVLRVAVYQDYKPYSWSEGGRTVGIDADLAEALAKKMGVKLDLFELRADDDINDDLRNGVWRGSVVGAAPGDVMLHVPYDKRIEKENDRVALVGPYHVDGLAMITDPAKASGALDLSLFRQEKVAVADGTFADMILISVDNHSFISNVRHEKGIERAAAAFERGEVPAFYGEASASEALARAGQRPFAIVYPKTSFKSEWPLGMAVKADSRDLGAWLGEEMRKLEDSGEVSRIFAKYGVDWRKPEKLE